MTNITSFKEQKLNDADNHGNVANTGGDDDGMSSWSHLSEPESATTSKERLEKEMQTSITRKEERIVGIVRILVVVAIICSAMAVSVAVYFFATESDTTNFELEVSLPLPPCQARDKLLSGICLFGSSIESDIFCVLDPPACPPVDLTT